MAAETVWSAARGMLVGYVGWLVATSIGAALGTVSSWSLVVLALSVLLAIWSVVRGQRLRRQRNYSLAAFVFGLPILPVALTLGVLAATYSG
ncbi:hypothetical protein MFM001_18050 [Mycobacterium sp. MFM001]|uniref:hypothetical protein n=1 Tax=Mycobacterium sp. MFM001 TaxID=2049453 RepID=UPI000DA47C2B|nr:hypothetical protein [Mycobacterium sp. MFM001]GBE65343.1 hypothetical protein MFM001_18050 [Mycobacterium sp. MFM001]